MDPLTVVVIGGLAAVNLAMLVGIMVLQRKIGERDQDVNSAQRDLDRLKAEANNIAFAKILLRTEHAVGTDLQESIRELTDGFTQQLNGPLLRMATQMERGVGKVLEQHMETLTSLQAAAVKQLERDAGELLGQYRETLAGLREAAETPAGQFKAIAAQEQATLSAHLQAEMKKQQENLLSKFDAKLSDVVSSYLTETLGNDIDLGSQGPYLFRMLEEHKGELKQEIAEGA
jgi:hypothetical protein